MGVQRISKVKNKNPAEIQITAEQLLAEAQAHKIEDSLPPVERITDPAELDDYKYRTRKEYEDKVRRQTHHIGAWMKYAEWEAGLKEFRRARSVYERALEVDYQHVTLWLRYAEMEMKNKFINHARNVWERACKLLPGVDQFWLKYAYMEEVLSNYDKVREIFESWLTWHPKDNAWLAFLKFEERMGNYRSCRDILDRFIDSTPNVGDQEMAEVISRYMQAAKFEEKLNDRERARLYYERALAELGEACLQEYFFLAFCRFEIKCKEYERARVLFKYALDRIPKGKAARLYNTFVRFEKQHGTYEEMEDVILNKRRSIYEEEITKDPLNYDVWFDYTRLEESSGNIDKTRDVYERAISNLPPIQDKKYWKRYIYLWINYAIFEEEIASISNSTNESSNSQQIYEKLLSIIPHEKFSFSKIWILFAHYYIRQMDITKARKIMGQAIGKCPSKKIFEAYVEIENMIANFEACRKIYQKWIELIPNDDQAWTSYANFEVTLDEFDRARFIFKLATQRDIDYPENVWKAYIDFEISIENYDEARQLFRQLLDQTNHIKVWIGFAKFEIENAQSYKDSRNVYSEAYEYYKTNEPELKEERLMILESWIEMEKEHGTESSYEEVKMKMPKRVKKRRKIKVIYNDQQEGDQNKEDEGGWEEFYDYIFPDDESQKRNIKILEMARKMNKQGIV